MKKKSVLYLAAGVFLLAALVLIVRYYTGDFAYTDIVKVTDVTKTTDVDEALALHVDAILRLKDKCGFETKIENEDSCNCDVERKVNAEVDAIEKLVRENASLRQMNVMFHGAIIPVQKLSDERLPISPECN